MHYLQWSVMAIATLFPMVVFVVPKGANSSFYLLLLFGLAGLACRCKPMGKSFGEVLREYWPIHLAMASLVCAILLNQWSSGNFSFKTYDMPFRLACFALIFWILLLVPDRHLKNVQWGLLAGTFICAAVLYFGTRAGIDRPLRLFNVPIVPFANIAILMGILTLFSIAWNRSNEKFLIGLKLLAGASALYGSHLSQTRGSWIVLPVFVAIAWAFLTDVKLRHKAMLVLLSTILLLGSYMLSNTVQTRVNDGMSDVSQYFQNKNLNTPVGIRLQLWRGSWLAFMENPFFGIGRERYANGALLLADRGEITLDAATHPHSHNELLFHMMTLGVFGMVAILSLYFVPAFFFLREIRHPDRELRTVAGMGLALTLGFFVFGLTDVMFYWSVSYTFYVIVLAVLFAHLVKRKASLQE